MLNGICVNRQYCRGIIIVKDPPRAVTTGQTLASLNMVLRHSRLLFMNYLTVLSVMFAIDWHLFFLFYLIKILFMKG